MSIFHDCCPLTDLTLYFLSGNLANKCYIHTNPYQTNNITKCKERLVALLFISAKIELYNAKESHKLEMKMKYVYLSKHSSPASS